MSSSPTAPYDKRWWTLAVLCLSLVLTVAGNSSLNVALPDIGRKLDAAPSALQWIVDAYGLVFAGLLLPAGALADRFGRKTSLQTGLVLFSVAGAWASFASEIWHLIVARCVMGVAAAFIMPATLSILANVFPDPAERRRAISIWAGFAALGGALGTLASGYLLVHFDWPAVFLVNVPICLLALVAGWFLVPNSSDPEEAVLDPLGSILAVGFLGLLIFGIIEGPTHGWISPVTLGTLAGGLAFGAVFVWWELRTDHPMLDVRLFRIRSFAIGSSTITLQFMAMFGLWFTVAQYLQYGRGYSPMRSALCVLPVGVFAMIGAPLSARNVGRFGPRRVVGSGLLVSGSGLLLLGVTGSATAPLGIILVGLGMVGLGNGQTTAPSTALIMSSVPRAKSGVGSAVNDLSRELGGALGIAVLGSVLTSVYRSDIVQRLAGLPTEVQVRAQTSIVATFDQAKEAATPEQAEVLTRAGKEAFGHAFGRTMLVAAGVIYLNSLLVWRFQARQLPTPVGSGPTPVAPEPTTEH